MDIEKTAKVALLYDFYGSLLTEKQSAIFELYYENDLSLGEIGQEINISRQAVHDSLKKTEAVLDDYERKLGMCSGSRRRETLIDKIHDELEADMNQDTIKAYLQEMGE